MGQERIVQKDKPMSLKLSLGASCAPGEALPLCRQESRQRWWWLKGFPPQSTQDNLLSLPFKQVHAAFTKAWPECPVSICVDSSLPFAAVIMRLGKSWPSHSGWGIQDMCPVGLSC